MTDQPRIKTSAKNWLKEVAEHYKRRENFLLEDDAHIGIDPRVDTLLRMGLKSQLSRREWAAVFVSLGVAGVGVWLLVMAVLDPEPFSKIMVALVTGAILLGTGSTYAIKILTNVKPPTIHVGRGGFRIEWD